MFDLARVTKLSASELGATHAKAGTFYVAKDPTT